MKKLVLTFALFINILIYLPAQNQYFYTTPLLAPYIESAPEINSRAAVLIDAATGTLLYSKNPDIEIPPASLTKLMTMHLLMKEIKEGRASYDETIPVTVESWAQSQPPGSSLMFLAPGQTVSLREILLGLAISSGNDAAVAAALRVSLSMEDFAHMMNMEARRMGLLVTRFVESSGISEYNVTTAQEFAWFCLQYLALHPNSLEDFHSVPTFSYPLPHNVPERYRRPDLDYLPYINRSIPHTISQDNRNTLLKSFHGVDGFKTGFINESGYNIALTAERNNTRFILVTLGAETSHLRTADGTRLLTWAFENFKTVRPVPSPIENARLWKGRAGSVELELAYPLDFTSPVDRSYTLNFEAFYPKPITAPLSAGDIVGYYIASDENGELNRIPLVTVRAYERGNIFKRIWHSILLLFKK